MFSIRLVQDIMAVSFLIPSIQQQRIIPDSCREAAFNSHTHGTSSISIETRLTRIFTGKRWKSTLNQCTVTQAGQARYHFEGPATSDWENGR